MTKMKVIYDSETDAVRITMLGRLRGSTDSLDAVRCWWVVVHLEHERQYSPIVGLEIIGASACLPLGKGGYYDDRTDVLLLGEKDAANCVVPNEDLVVYWGTEVDGSTKTTKEWPVAVEVRSARKWLGNVNIPARP